MSVTFPPPSSPLSEPTRIQRPVSTARCHMLVKRHTLLAPYFRVHTYSEAVLGSAHTCSSSSVSTQRVHAYATTPKAVLPSEHLRRLKRCQASETQMSSTKTNPSLPENWEKGWQGLPHRAELMVARWQGDLWESRALLPVLSAP